ncbi:sensor histidine kinase [Caldicellulosiruptoraceae bacterium PP1]
MRRTIIKYMSFLIILICFLEGFLSYFMSKNLYIEENKRILKENINILESIMIEDKNWLKNISKIARNITSDVRITIIEYNGKVIFDSYYNANKMENHLNREEIINAKKTKDISYAIRKSPTLKFNYLYGAKLINKDSNRYFIRTSIELNKINQILKDALKKVIIIIIVCVFIGVILSIILSIKLSNPLRMLLNHINSVSDFEIKSIKKEKQDELSIIGDTLNNIYFKLKEKILEIKNLNYRLNLILNTIDIGVIFLDKKYRVLAFNREAEKIFGVTLNTNISILEGIRIYDIYLNLVNNKFEESEINITVKGVNKIIKYRTIEINDSEFQGYLLLFNDITRLKKLENIRSDFAANVTHELKTPLTSIKGFVETLKSGALDDKNVSERFLNIIEIEVDRLQRLIEDILYISEIETINIKTNEFVSISEVLHECLDILREKAENKNIDINVSIKYDIKFNMKKDFLKQVMLNLIDNAIIYNKVNGTIEIKVYEDNTNKIIEVIDSGIGIPKEDIERIFERFYRVDKGRSRESGGTGLGLSIVKHIVRSHNGNIEVESEINKGSLFRILFKK